MHELDTSAPGHHGNPFALPGAAGDALGALLVPATVAYAPAVIGAMAGLVVRLRRSRGVERQQLKWVAYVGSLMLSALLLAAVSLAFRSPLVDPIGTIGWGVFLLLVVFGLPAAVAHRDPAPPVVRHRRYRQPHAGLRRALGDPGRGLVGGVVIFQRCFAAFASGSDLAVAGTTLAVAALVRPGRTRVQHVVDRRFYRHKYDSEHTIDAFSSRLRDELDLNTGRGDARRRAETMQPGARLTSGFDRGGERR